MFSVMVRRSTPQAKRDDLAFPIRVKITVPPHGLGKELDFMIAWLREHIAPGDCANHSAPGVACDTAAFYFRSTEAAQAFLAAFPNAKLANGTVLSR